MTEPDLEAARLRLVAAATAAGETALRSFRKGARAASVVSWKAGDSPVTEADHASNAILLRDLRQAGDGIGWLSEETLDDGSRLEARALWIVDPIDGTRAFMTGEPEWTVCAALVIDGAPAAGVVHAPALGRTASAVRGAGAWMNGARLHAAPPQGSVRMAGPRPLLDRLAPAFGAVTVLPRVRSLAWRLVGVAAGTADAALASGDAHDWDIAAADLILSEAGAGLVTFEGEKPVYNRADPVHPALLAGTGPVRAALLKAAGAPAAT